MADRETLDALKAVGLLIDYARQEVLPRLKDLRDPEAHIITLALFARSLSAAEGAVQLARGGFGREVMILNRALFEMMVDAHWAYANPELARERFVQHARFDQNLRRKLAPRYPELLGEPEQSEGLPAEEVADLEGTFGRYGAKGWTGLRLPERIAEIENQFREGEHRRQLWMSYQVLNAFSNAELHPSSWSLARALRRVPIPGGGTKLQLRTEPERELVPGALQQTWFEFGELLGLIVPQVGLPLDEFLEVGDAGAALLGTERLADEK